MTNHREPLRFSCEKEPSTASNSQFNMRKKTAIAIALRSFEDTPAFRGGTLVVLKHLPTSWL